MAPFSRTTDDRKHEIFLLSPAAAYLSADLNGKWTEALDVFDHQWTVLVANGDAREQFGILISSDDRNRFFKEGKKYWVNVSVDNAKPQRLLAVAYGKGAIGFPDLTFDAIKAFADGAQIRFGYKDRILATLNLKGS